MQISPWLSNKVALIVGALVCNTCSHLFEILPKTFKQMQKSLDILEDQLEEEAFSGTDFDPDH